MWAEVHPMGNGEDAFLGEEEIQTPNDALGKERPDLDGLLGIVYTWIKNLVG